VLVCLRGVAGRFVFGWGRAVARGVAAGRVVRAWDGRVVSAYCIQLCCSSTHICGGLRAGGCRQVYIRGETGLRAWYAHVAVICGLRVAPRGGGDWVQSTSVVVCTCGKAGVFARFVWRQFGYVVCVRSDLLRHARAPPEAGRRLGCCHIWVGKQVCVRAGGGGDMCVRGSWT
jgi:hypothetical protein